MDIPVYQVDAFTDRLFAGNPAAVCVLDEELPDDLLQNIARENNLSETAFIRKTAPDQYTIRWFTPTVEVDLCGHATLAAAFVVLNELKSNGERVEFLSRSKGTLYVTRSTQGLTLDFPLQPVVPCDPVPGLSAALGAVPEDLFKGDDYLAVFASESDVRNLSPDFIALTALDIRGIIVTAPGDTADFVSRFFAPRLGINEDPVTGSAHCSLIPYWERRTGKAEFTADQVSDRGGRLFCRRRGGRARITGQARLFMKGFIPLEGNASAKDNDFGLSEYHDEVRKIFDRLGQGAEQLVIPPQCVRSMGIRHLGYTPGASFSLEVPTTIAFTNPSGTMQGGWISAAFDNAFGPFSILETEGVTTSLDLNVTYLRPVPTRAKRLVITVYRQEMSRRYIVMRGEARLPDGRLAATATSRMAVVISA